VFEVIGHTKCGQRYQTHVVVMSEAHLISLTHDLEYIWLSPHEYVMAGFKMATHFNEDRAGKLSAMRAIDQCHE
jgi:hypothetical protein